MVKIMVTLCLFIFDLFFGGVTYLLHHFYYEFTNLVGPLGLDQDHPTLRLQQWQPQCYLPFLVKSGMIWLCHIIY